MTTTLATERPAKLGKKLPKLETQASTPPVIMIATKDLEPHPLHADLYGPPGENSRYDGIKEDMEQYGFDRNYPILATKPNNNGKRIILRGRCSWFIADKLGITEIPCIEWEPSTPETADAETEQQIIRGNAYRTKTHLHVAREMRKLIAIEHVLGKQRMGKGTDGGPSRAEDRVGAMYKQSGKQVLHNLKVLDAIDDLEAKGDAKSFKRADRLTELMKEGKVNKAYNLATGKKPEARTRKPAKVHTLIEHGLEAKSQFEQACSKATIPLQLKMLQEYLDEMKTYLENARKRVKEEKPAKEPKSPAKGESMPPEVEERISKNTKKLAEKMGNRK